MSDVTTTNPGPAEAPHPVEQLTRGDQLHQVLIGTGIASGLALLWTLESMRNAVFHVLNALHIPAWRHKRGSAFPAGPRRA